LETYCQTHLIDRILVEQKPTNSEVTEDETIMDWRA